MNKRETLLDALLMADNQPSIASSITSQLLFGPQSESDIFSVSAIPRSDCQRRHLVTVKEKLTKPLDQNSDIGLHRLAVRNVTSAIQQSLQLLPTTTNPRYDQSLVYRALTIQLLDISHLIAISAEPGVTYALIDVHELLLVAAHMLATYEFGFCDGVVQEFLESVSSLCGALFLSHRGISEIVSAFEDKGLERAWFACCFGNAQNDPELITQLRRRPGVLSIAEEIHKTSRHFEISPSIGLSKVDIGIATAILVDSWRTSHTLIRLELEDLEQMRRHSELVSHTCIELAKICAYECGREV